MYDIVSRIMLKKNIDIAPQDNKAEGTLSETQQGLSMLSTT